MTYRDTLDYLYRQLPMFQRVGPAAYKKDLTNTLALCEHLGNPQHRFKSIHIGGTNGKGSVSHMLAAICQAAGLKTGLYVSPHYKDFRERIKVNGTYIPQSRVVEFVEKNLDAIERIEPSFFELCVAMAFDHFAREKVDVAIVEVGLGGRLDSTNVITPLLSVITNISYDHQNLLGETLPEIAGEKAGIIKPGIPVVIGETHPESAPVFEKKARETGAPIVFADQHFQVKESASTDWLSSIYTVSKNGVPYLENLKVAAGGPFQSRNVATVVQAWQILGATSLPEIAGQEILRTGLSELRTLTRFMGRWQIIGEQPLILCDSAHNEAGLRIAFERIGTMPFRQLHIVTGFVNDKDVTKTLGYFPVQARYYFAKADIPRGLEATVLQEKAAGFGLHGRAYTSVRNALKAARRAAQPDDMIVVIGSIFVVAEAI
ncbi:MAG TPA: folylpolyglutamate synthase/dihydrofolate synthase family protein [Saprospiraceae bacterium]|nr:folylpolyglutamate synthase/dihydrofolate synthase family protein [Saprospiraceae bacterium]HPI05634.1 folylpolyglutamate synthase/dihydrofolate synthase family protein [Saprospiraceae bacterium]